MRAKNDPTATAKVAANLRAILDMAERLRDRAIDHAGDHEIIGGEAMVNLAGVASMADWTRRNELAADALAPFEDPDELWPAEQMLRYWSEQWRIVLGHDHDDPRWQPTLVSEAAFLANPDVLDWVWNHESHFDEYAADVARARTKLENTLVEGDRAERTRVVCPDCDAGRRLIRVYEARKESGWACLECSAVVHGDEEHCPNRLCWSVVPPQPIDWVSDPANDEWKCPSCRHRFKVQQLNDAYAKQMRGQGGDRYVTHRDAIAMLKPLGWQERTIRRWIEPLRCVDRCSACGETWPVQEYAACPRKTLDHGEAVSCGGLLEPMWKGDRETVPDSYCDLRTRDRFVYWPDLWRRHLLAQQVRATRIQSWEVAM